jgi:hypothetical protein
MRDKLNLLLALGTSILAVLCPGLDTFKAVLVRAAIQTRLLSRFYFIEAYSTCLGLFLF